MRVLIVAENANPEWVSVPLEGWCHSRAIARRCEAHVVVHVRNRAAFERAGLVEGEDFTAIDTEWISRPLYEIAERLRGGQGKGWTTVAAFEALAYYAFELQVWRRFGERIRSHEFDVVHRMIPLSPTTPSWSLPRGCRRAAVPFVLGPINGGVPWPRAFDAVRRTEREWLTYVRSAYKLMPGYRATRRLATAIIVGSRDTWRLEPSWVRDKLVYIPENAVAAERFPRPDSRPFDAPLRAAFVGRLVPYKGADMLIEAAAELARAGSLTLEIFGDGPERSRLEALIREHGLSGAVRLRGWVEHEQLQAELKSSHVFAFPSIREFGGAVVLEAMASGLVPIVVDYGGPGELVTDESGFRIPMGTRQEIVDGFHEVLAKLSANPQALAPMAETGLARVHRDFTWDAKAAQTHEVYRWAAGERSHKPDFGMLLEPASLERGSSQA